MNCLWCYKEIIPEITWSNLFQMDRPKPLCAGCEEKLVLLEGPRCSKCSRQTDDKICADCLWWKGNDQLDPIEFNYSIFPYNSLMQEIIAKWKYRGDYILGEIFKTYMVDAFQEKFSKIKKEAYAVPIPLSEERAKERGFNQAAVLAKYLPVRNADILSRKHGEKQSKKKRMDRIYTENPFFMETTINKLVILVDDIYTTGTTLRHAASMLKSHGCQKVYAFTLVRG
ncbi:ComF family protein [Oceanobacillus damuensis]|uniref:ComF family protein n=1 Tax=Oceanobacillus damuensis TaxID=937928 RepID=UPI000834CE69|nr:ComF family protein [Oceanobacillus damuensis]